jgi:hypothetical protein
VNAQLVANNGETSEPFPAWLRLPELQCMDDRGSRGGKGDGSTHSTTAK